MCNTLSNVGYQCAFRLAGMRVCRPAYRHLWGMKAKWQAQVVACTATACASATEDIVQYLHMREPRIIRASVVKQNLHIYVTEKGNKARSEVSLIQMLHLSTSQRVPVFCCERDECERIRDLILKNHIRAEAYHADVKTREGVEDRLRKGVNSSVAEQ